MDIAVPAFRPDELIACPECTRANAPNRTKCMYCAAALPVSERAEIKLSGRLLESWENGFNAVITGGKLADEAVLESIAIDRNVIEQLRSGIAFVPVLRGETEADATYVVRKLNDAGIESTVVADEQLDLKSPTIRLRRIEFGDGVMELTLFNSEETASVAVADVDLIVAGTIVETTTETVEKRSRKESTILDESQSAERELVLDIYVSGHRQGYRVYQRGFDFSCLGPDKAMIAAENMLRFAARLKETVGHERWIDDYDRKREVLDVVWISEPRSESHGLQKTGIGKSGHLRSQKTSNLEQFTRYSRMRRHLL